MTHVILIPFRDVGIDLRDDAWFEERIKIFKRYTLNSLLNQSNKDFVLWVTFRPQDKENPLVKQLDQDIKIPHVFTFDGLPYWDDKFGGDPLQRLTNIARMVRYSWRTGNWKELWPSVKQVVSDKNNTLQERLTLSLDLLHAHPKVYKGVTEHVLLTRIDSDDMFHKDATKEIQRLKDFNCEAVSLKSGYIYNTETGEVAEWNPPTNPPFHTIFFRNGDFWDSARHLAAYKGFRSHEDIPKVLLTVSLLPERRLFCVTTSNPKLHISTNWSHPFRGKLVDKEVLKDFGI